MFQGVTMCVVQYPQLLVEISELMLYIAAYIENLKQLICTLFLSACDFQEYHASRCAKVTAVTCMATEVL